MAAVQSKCRKLVKLEKEAVRNQVLEDLQLERRLYLTAITLLGANPMAVLCAPEVRKIQQFVVGLQQLSSVIHRNTQAMMKLYGLDSEKNVDSDLFNIDFLVAARSAGLKDTRYDARQSNADVK